MPQIRDTGQGVVYGKVGTTTGLTNGTPVGVGVNVAGKLVAGAGQSGILGLLIPPAGIAVDVQVPVVIAGEVLGMTGLAAGTAYYAQPSDGALVTTASGNTPIGKTLEADRLVVQG